MIYKTLEPLIDMYDSFLVDVYGVLYDGIALYDGVQDLLSRIVSVGKRVIILSNTTLVSQVCKARYAQKGLIENIHYNEFLSSGEIFRVVMKEYLGEFGTYTQIFNKNREIFKNCMLREVASIEEADFVYVGSMDSSNGRVYTVDDVRTKSKTPISIEDILTVNCSDIDGFEEIASVLNEGLRFNKPFVIVNPDIFAIESINGIKRPIICQGAIGEFYEALGGGAMYFGKPYKVIYDYAKRYLTGCERTAMIGDTPWTDILGGNMAKIDTILTLTGVFNKFTSNMSDRISIDEKIENVLVGISKKMTHRNLVDFSQRPTHIVHRFA
jgi:HAD superfamily hydrolase (TIGR01450 family)